MRTLVVTQNVTLDGVIDAAGGWFDPTADGFADVRAIVQKQAAASDALLVARQTFEDMRGFWPKQLDDTTGVTDHLNRVAKYVVSRTMADPAAWANRPSAQRSRRRGGGGRGGARSATLREEDDRACPTEDLAPRAVFSRLARRSHQR